MNQRTDDTLEQSRAGILSRLFPARIDNTYQGSKIALWILGLLIAVRTMQSVMILVNGYSIAQSADGIPLETYPAAAAQTIVALFTSVGGQSVSNLSDMCRGVGSLSARRAIDVSSAFGDLRRRSTGWPCRPNRQSGSASGRNNESDAARANDYWFRCCRCGNVAPRRLPDGFLLLACQMCFNKLRSSGCS